MIKAGFRKMSLAFLALTFAISSTALAGPQGKGPKGPTIVDVAVEVNGGLPSDVVDGPFDTLITAVLAADPAVVATLTGGGQHTVFAPTDDAFDDLGLNKDNICLLSTEELTKVLLFHVAKGRRDSGEVVASDTIKTLLGTRVEQANAVLTDALDRPANIVIVDVPAANGIIHAIDSVLLPFGPTIDPSGCDS